MCPRLIKQSVMWASRLMQRLNTVMVTVFACLQFSFHRFLKTAECKKNISELLERFRLQTAHLSTETRLSLLKQQCVGYWPRSALSIAKTTEGKAEKEAEEKLNSGIERLHSDFSESKEDKCCRLTIELSAIKQERGESVI